ncbi:MAG: outer membrane protein assembly factor BamE [Herminiimonas sp.]|nr:outer membrane protein assembly factor BamE [Herminiimonas sp.]MDB5854062.1 outer membrane protein assembly factor BamE [Herminiimonas sp.]
MHQSQRQSPFPLALAALPRALVVALLLTLGLASCASRNPLMDEPASPISSAPTQKNGASTDTASQSASPAQAASAATTAPATANAPSTPSSAGLQTTRDSSFLGFLTPYRPDIQQGNFVSREMIAQLKEGMTPEQVRFVLGTPMLADMFHADRWDYVFRLKRGNGELTSSRVTVFFKDNRLARYEGGDLPSEAEYLARIAGSIPLPTDDRPPRPRSAPASSGASPNPATAGPGGSLPR